MYSVQIQQTWDKSAISAWGEGVALYATINYVFINLTAPGTNDFL